MFRVCYFPCVDFAKIRATKAIGIIAIRAVTVAGIVTGNASIVSYNTGTNATPITI